MVIQGVTVAVLMSVTVFVPKLCSPVSVLRRLEYHPTVLRSQGDAGILLEYRDLDNTGVRFVSGAQLVEIAEEAAFDAGCILNIFSCELYTMPEVVCSQIMVECMSNHSSWSSRRF